MTELLKKAQDLLKAQTIEQLVTQFELTETQNLKHTPMVRGWLMDEMNERNPEGFNNWLESETCDDKELRKYML